MPPKTIDKQRPPVARAAAKKSVAAAKKKVAVARKAPAKKKKVAPPRKIPPAPPAVRNIAVEAQMDRTIQMLMKRLEELELAAQQPPPPPEPKVTIADMLGQFNKILEEKRPKTKPVEQQVEEVVKPGTDTTAPVQPTEAPAPPAEPEPPAAQPPKKKGQSNWLMSRVWRAGGYAGEWKKMKQLYKLLDTEEKVVNAIDIIRKFEAENKHELTPDDMDSLLYYFPKQVTIRSMNRKAAVNRIAELIRVDSPYVNLNYAAFVVYYGDVTGVENEIWAGAKAQFEAKSMEENAVQKQRNKRISEIKLAVRGRLMSPEYGIRQLQYLALTEGEKKDIMSVEPECDAGLVPDISEHVKCTAGWGPNNRNFQKKAEKDLLDIICKKIPGFKNQMDLELRISSAVEEWKKELEKKPDKYTGRGPGAGSCTLINPPP